MITLLTNNRTEIKRINDEFKQNVKKTIKQRQINYNFNENTYESDKTIQMQHTPCSAKKSRIPANPFQ